MLNLLLLACVMVIPFQVNIAADTPENTGVVQNPGTDLWRQVRQRDMEIVGTSQVKSPGANVMINVAGQEWREYRVLTLIPKAGLVIFLGLLGVFVFRILRGNIKLSNGRSGIKILRFSQIQRYTHWTTAILFIVLALTGLILMFGRKFLLPVFGPEAFGSIAIAGKAVHDYLGPVFLVSLTILFILFVRDNIPSPKLDLKWIMQGGGLFGKHASSDRYNAGEKGWFWIASLVGLVLVISGMILDFPIFGQSRETMEFYLFVHGIAAVIMIVASFGHIYMGTAALEGTFEVMQTGYCDSNWAKDHHDLWYEKVKDSQAEASPQEQSSEADDGARQRSPDTA